MVISKSETRIILVEDKENMQMLFTEYLSKLGYSQIEVSDDGFDVLNKVVKYKPHLILMDTDIPGPSGYVICRRLNQHEFGARMAIIGMSEDDSVERKQLWLKAGADFFLPKGEITLENLSLLEEKIQTALGKYYY